MLAAAEDEIADVLLYLIRLSDKPIVREVSQVLANHAVNVESLETHVASAPMSADVLFHAVAELTAARDLDVAALTAALERISNDLMVDITLDETLAS